MEISRIRRDDAILVMIDFQERLMPAMKNEGKVISQASMLAAGCKEFDIPVLVTQQYTKGMGETVGAIAGALGEFEPIEKKEFSCMQNDDFKAALEDSDKDIVIVCGCETHVCVQQTVLDLLAQDYIVYVAGDCVSSRRGYTRDTALHRMAGAGAVITNAETVLFEILGSADDPHFKTISKLVK